METLAARLARYERRRQEKVKAREEKKAAAKRKAKRLEEKLALGPPAPRKVKPKPEPKVPSSGGWAKLAAVTGHPYRVVWSEEPITARDCLDRIGPDTKAYDARALVAFALTASGMDLGKVAAAIGADKGSKATTTTRRLITRGYELSRKRPPCDEIPEPPAD